MSPKIEELLAQIKGFIFCLSTIRLIGILIGVGVLVVTFFATVGIKNGPSPLKPTEFRPYRPERRSLAPETLSGTPEQIERASLPASLGPGLEASVLEEVQLLREEIDKLRSSVVASSQRREVAVDRKVASMLQEVQKGLQTVSSEINALKQKMEKDEQALTEQAPVELLGVVSSAGLNYAILRTEVGDKRVTEGDRVGPWMVVEIEHGMVHLEGSGQARVLRLKQTRSY